MGNFANLGTHTAKFVIEIAFLSNPFDASPIWTDVTQDVLEWAITGPTRQSVIDRHEAGVLELVLDNQQRRYDPLMAGAGANIITNPWFQTDTTGWAIGANNTLTRSDTEKLTGTHSGKCEYGTGGATNLGSFAHSLVSGTAYQFAMAYYIPASWPAGTTLTMQARNFDAPDSVVSVNLGIRDRWQWVYTTKTTTTDLDGNISTHWGGATPSNGDHFFVDHATVRAQVPTSPFANDILPMRPIRVLARWAGTNYERFRGFIETWPIAYLGAGGLAVSHITAVDGSRMLREAQLPGAAYPPNQRTGDRIGLVLTDANWPAADRTLSTGQLRVGAELAAGNARDSTASGPALDYIEEIVESEGGAFYLDGAGKAVFRDRHYRLVQAATSQATFGDDNLVVNGGFETGQVSPWLGDGTNLLEISTAEVFAGSASLKATWQTGGSTTLFRQPITLPADQATTFRIGLWISDLDVVSVALEAHNFGTAVNATSAADLGLRNGWQELDVTFSPVAADLSGDIAVVISGATNGFFMYADSALVTPTAEIPYMAIESTFDDAVISNAYQVGYRPTPEASDIVAGEDIASQAKYGIRTREISTRLWRRAQAEARGQQALWRRAEPGWRIRSIDCELVDDERGAGLDIPAKLLALKVWDRVTVRRRPPGGGLISQQLHIEGIRERVEHGRWVIGFDLSPIDPDGGVTNPTFLKIGHATQGQLGQEVLAP